MNEAPIILAIVGALLAWTASVATLTLWLASRFRDIERLIYREMHALDVKYDKVLKDHSDRIMVIELKKEGYTGTQSVSKT